MKSMTGFGSSTKKSKLAEINVTLKSINGRFLEIRTSIPSEYDPLEIEIKKMIGEKIKRGSISLSINRIAEDEGIPSIKTQVAEGIFKNLESLNKKLKLKSDISLEHILKFPEVISAAAKKTISNDEEKVLFEAVKSALQICDQERSREGKVLNAEIKEHLQSLKDKKDHISKNSHLKELDFSEKYAERLKKLGAKNDLDPARLAQEIIILMDKMDISEEITRIGEHLSVLSKIVETSEGTGKKLEFYTQELFREFNTIGSKSQLPEITKTVIDCKVIIERIREQVQNIE